MTRQSTLRPALTLTEVLVALFVMAVGMIALLTLFPLGAMQIGQGIKDQRTADAAIAADAIYRSIYRQNVTDPLQNGSVSETDLVDPTKATCLNWMTAMEQPNLPLLNDVPPTNVLFQRTASMPALSDATFVTPAANMDFPSYPVFVDPNGELFRRSTFPRSRRWVAGVHPNAAGGAAAVQALLPRIPRRTLNFPTQSSLLGSNWQYRYTTLQDDLDFGDDGIANQSGTGVSKTGRYNWAWMLQRPKQGNRKITNMTVVVYDQRAYNYARAEDEVAYPFTVQLPKLTSPPTLFNITSITIQYNANASRPVPSIRAGQWIMDGTITTMQTAPNAGIPVRTANFYRVTSVTDNNPGSPVGTMTFDLQTSFKFPQGVTQSTVGPVNYPNDPTTNPPPNVATLATQGQIYILRGVAEVFERRPLSPDDTQIIP